MQDTPAASSTASNMIFLCCFEQITHVSFIDLLQIIYKLRNLICAAAV